MVAEGWHPTDESDFPGRPFRLADGIRSAFRQELTG